MHILVLEISLSGHHANYLERIALMFLSQGHRVTVCVREAELRNPMLAKILEAHPTTCRVEALPPQDWIDCQLSRLGVVGGELIAWRSFRRFFKGLQMRNPVDRVFHPYLDYCLHATALFGPPSGNTPWAGICTRPSFHLRHLGVIAPTPNFAVAKEWLFRRLLHSPGLLTLFTIDGSLERYVRQLSPDIAGNLQHWPEPAELSHHYSRQSARARLGISPELFVILVYGSIDGRKGIDWLLEGLRYQSFPQPVRVLVVGRHSDAIRQTLNRDPLVASLDGYASSDTEEAAFRAADLVWLGYRSHYTLSAVLLLAASAGVPVIATHQGLIACMTREYDLGDVINVERASEIAGCVLKRMGAPHARSFAGKDIVRGKHTWEKGLRSLSDGFLIANQSKK